MDYDKGEPTRQDRNLAGGATGVRVRIRGRPSISFKSCVRVRISVVYSARVTSGFMQLIQLKKLTEL